MNEEHVHHARKGARHSELQGGHEAYRYRPKRLDSGSLCFPPICRFRYNGRNLTAREVIDVSPTGVGIVPDEEVYLETGAELEEVEISHCNHRVWHGRARIVNRGNERHPRLGLHFLGGRLNLKHLHFRDQLVEDRLSRSLREVHDFCGELPADWRAGISTLRQILGAAKEVMDDMEQREDGSEWRQDSERKRALCTMVFDKWWPTFRDQVLRMDQLSSLLKEEHMESAQTYASMELMPLLTPCPMHSRSYEKPRGYAGDFEMMNLGQADELQGKSLFGCLLHHLGQNYSLGKTVIARGASAFDAVVRTASIGRKVRIVSLASGPAIELRDFLIHHGPFQNEIELILVDQDFEALEDAEEALSRILVEREDAHKVTLKCLHFSVKQIMCPQDASERQLVQEDLHNVDLVYSMGLYDYLELPVAVRLSRKLLSMLAPGGRLLVGNLERVPDSSWVMDFVTHWHLVYREEQDMHDIAQRVRMPLASKRVFRDSTGHCLFLDLRIATSP